MAEEKDGFGVVMMEAGVDNEMMCVQPFESLCDSA